MKYFVPLIALLAFSSEVFSEGHSLELKIWPTTAPGEDPKFNIGKGVAEPLIFLFQPEIKTSDSCIIICPGGGYNNLAIDHEGHKIAHFYNSKGMTAIVLKYRVPRRFPEPNRKHIAAWQDVQRAIRVVRSHEKDWGFHSEKIGILGFSAGGHLTLMAATTSQTPAYEAIDELDKTVPCHVNFAVPVYPAYVLEDGMNGPNKDQGNNSTMVKDFAFDAKTPPMCFIHGDIDGYSPMGSIAVYHKLRTMKIPAEIHIFSKVGHGFGAKPTLDPNNRHVGDWLNRSYEALKVFGF